MTKFSLHPYPRLLQASLLLFESPHFPLYFLSSNSEILVLPQGVAEPPCLQSELPQPAEPELHLLLDGNQIFIDIAPHAEALERRSSVFERGNLRVFILVVLEIDNPSLAHEAKVAMLANCIKPHALLPLPILAYTLQLGARNHPAAVVAEQVLVLFDLGEAPAEHLEDKGDLEVLRVDLIQSQHLPVEVDILLDERCQGSLVEQRVTAIGLDDVHLVYYLLHTQVKILIADAKGLLLMIQAVFSVGFYCLDKLLRLLSHLLCDMHSCRTDMTGKYAVGGRLEAHRSDEVRIEFLVWRVLPKR